MREESCTGKLSLMGHGCLEGVIQHVKKFDMDFIEVMIPEYETVSTDAKVGSHIITKYQKFVGFKSAGMFTYNAIYGIDIHPVKFEKDNILEEYTYEELPF